MPSKFPTYKRKEREILAWLLVALARMRIQEDKPAVTVIHFNLDFIRRFKQLVRLGQLGTIDYTPAKWELTEPSEIHFLPSLTSQSKRP